MPTVNGYQRRVREAAAPSVQVSDKVSLETFGGGRVASEQQKALSGLADSASSAGGMVNQYAEDEKRKANDSMFTDLDLEASKEQTRIEGEYRKMQGKNSAEAPDYVQKQWEAVKANIMKRAGNAEQRAAIDKALKHREANLDKGVHGHMGDEFKRHDNEQSMAYLQSTREEALNNYKDPERIALALTQQEGELRKIGERNGDSAELVNHKIASTKSLTHESIVNRMLDTNNDQGAKAYFEANVNNLLPSDKAKLEKALEIGSLRGESQRQSDKIMATSPGLTEALEAAKKIDNPKLRDEVTSRVKDNYSLKKAAEAEHNEAKFQSYADTLSSAGRGASMDLIPAAERAAMTVEYENKLKDHVKNLREGVEAAANGEVYYDLKTLASTKEGQAEFLKKNLRLHINDMPKSELHEMIEIQTNLREKNGKSDKTLDGFRSDNQIVNDVMQAAGIDPTPKPGTDNAKSVAALRGKVDAQVRALQEKEKRKINNDELLSIVDANVKKVVTSKGWFFDTKKSVFDLKAGEKFDVSAEDVPDSEKIKIKKYLREKNLPASDEEIARRYKNKLSRAVNSE